MSLATHAWSYEDVGRGEVANLAVLDTLVYATAADDGVIILSLNSGVTVGTMPPPVGTESIDDVAIAGMRLFVLDAVAPGHLSVFSLADPLRPRLIGTSRAVPVGPFSGVSAADGLVMVSGGTSELTAWALDTSGALRGPIATGDLGRGQPDVAVAPGGRVAYVSTHYRGPAFGLDVVLVDTTTRSVEPLARLPLQGAGFTDGGARPSSFPIVASVHDEHTVLVAHGRGVAVIDAVNPEAPRLTDVLDVGGAATHVHVLHDTAAVVIAGPSPAVALIDLSVVPARVFRRLPLAPGTFPLGVVLAPSRIVVAIRHQGTVIFDR